MKTKFTIKLSFVKVEAILQHQPRSWGPGCPLSGVAGVWPGLCQPSQQLSLLSTLHTQTQPITVTASGHAGLQRGSQEAVRQPRWIEAEQIQQPWPHLQIRGWGIHLCGGRPGNIALSPFSLYGCQAQAQTNLNYQIEPIKLGFLKISKKSLALWP